MALYNCLNCKKRKADLMERGHYECRECGAIYWTIFDAPVAGRKGPGEKCGACGNITLHLVAEMDKVQVFRCSACAFTLLRPTE